MKALAALAALAAFSTTAFAEQTPAAAEEAAPAFNVIQEDVRIPFSTRVLRYYRVGRDDSLLLNIGANRWYRATVWQPCRRELKWDHAISFDTGPGDTLDRFSVVRVGGFRCPIESLDQIEEPARDTTH